MSRVYSKKSVIGGSYPPSRDHTEQATVYPTTIGPPLSLLSSMAGVHKWAQLSRWRGEAGAAGAAGGKGERCR